MKKLTTEEFIENYTQKYGEKYDFSKAKYVNNKTLIDVICKQHGLFKQRPNDLLNGYGCPCCGGTKKGNTKSFIEKANFVHNNYFSYEKTRYTSSNEKVVITCPIHGDFEQKANNHLNGQGCSKCWKEHIKHDINKLTKTNNSTKKYTTEEFVRKCQDRYGSLYTYQNTNYIKNNEKVCITCRIHGDFYVTPNHFLGGRHCPKCAKNKSLTTDEFIQKANDVHKNKYSYKHSEYITTHKNIIVTCLKHGNFYISPANHLSGQGCPICNQSKLEEKVQRLLDENNIEYTYQADKNTFKWLNRQTLDFYLPKFNIAIECQGIQHFQPINFFGGKESYNKTKDRDLLKREKCAKNGVKLLYYTEISLPLYPYSVITNINELLSSINNDTSIKEKKRGI